MEIYIVFFFKLKSMAGRQLEAILRSYALMRYERQRAGTRRAVSSDKDRPL